MIAGPYAEAHSLVGAVTPTTDHQRAVAGFPWNAGGWFGSQLGGTLWMFISGAVLIPYSMGEAALVIAVALLANGAGFCLWRARAKLAPHRALQALTWLIGAATAANFLMIDGFGHLAVLDERLEGGFAGWWWVLLLFPGLSLLFWLRFRGKQSSQVQDLAAETLVSVAESAGDAGNAP